MNACREYRAMVEAELAHYDLSFTHGRGKKNPFVEIALKGGRRIKFVYPGHKSTRRAGLNCRSELRRCLRDHGAELIADKEGRAAHAD